MCDNRTSKRIITILRHSASEHGINIDSRGFVDVDELLQQGRFNHLTPDNIKTMVKNDSKNRYSLEIINNKLKVRANQGHSINVDLDLEPVLSAKNYPNAIHGTNRLAWNNISKSGISRMNRKHIHFAIGEPGDKKVTSGMPPRSDIMIFLNLTLALQNGIKLFKSKNDVILSEGDEEGYIRPKYFLKVIDRNTRQDLI